MTDQIALDRTTVLNSPDVHSWPITTQITKLELRPTGIHVEFTKQDGAGRWPDVPFGDKGGTLQYTVWIVLSIASSWWAAGVVEFWYGLAENGGDPGSYAKNLYYDANRWTPMTGHQPKEGEIVGFLVTPGDARHGTSGEGAAERSNIVAVPFPGPAGGSWTWPLDPSIPQPEPTPAPAPDPTPAPAPEDLDRAAVILHTADLALALERDMAAVYAWIEGVQIEAKRLRVDHYFPPDLPPRQSKE